MISEKERAIRLRHAKGMASPRQAIWKRVRCWSGMVLVVVVGIGGLLYWSYRRSLGPPPTPPAKSREFDVLSGRGPMLLASVPSGTPPYLAESRSGQGLIGNDE
jgi:hypothetical protein